MKNQFTKTYLNHTRNTNDRAARLVGLMILMLASQFVLAQNLSDFGYDHMKVNGKSARGMRPLLVIMAHFIGGKTWTHTDSYYDSLIYTFQQPSVNGYYAENSNGRFLWRKAAPIVGPLYFSSDDLTRLDLGDPQGISEVITKASYSVNFSQWDSNGDGTVTGDELSILIIDNKGDIGGATRAIAPAGYLDLNGVRVSSEVSVVDHRASLMTFCHELSHQLGTLDLYSGDCKGCLNRDITLMGATIYDERDDMRTYHLDPWHKMQLGWVEPRIRDLRQPGTEFLYANQVQKGGAPVILYDSRYNVSEFFMLEYRSKTARSGGYDSNVYSEGLGLWHVQQNTDKTPTILSNPREWAVFHAGASDLKRGSNQLWKGGTITPNLKWNSGVPLPIKLYVEPFVPGTPNIVVNWVNWQDGGGSIYAENMTGQFRQMAGRLKEIEASNGLATFVWGINSFGQAFRFGEASQQFEWVPGSYKQISVDIQGEAWALGENTWPYLCSRGTNSFGAHPISFAQIAAGEGGVWGLNSRQEIFRLNPEIGIFDQIPGYLVKIVVGYGPGNVWGINLNNDIFRFNPDTQEFEQIEGKLVQIAVSRGESGAVWGINLNNDIFRFNQETQQFEYIPGKLVKIGVGEQGVWGLNSEHSIFKFDEASQRFNGVPGSLMSISVTAEGAAWGINAY